MAEVLIVDDSAFQRRITRKMVAGEGHEIREADSGRRCLELVAEAAPDCILLDLLMPEFDGLETLRALRDMGAAIPVVVLTADIQDSVRNECLELGAFRFLNKPPKPDEVTGAIANAIGASA